MFTDAEANLCTRHVNLMLEWNRRLNLTRIVSHNDIIVKHLLDSIVPAKYLPHSGPALDVGTGAGFPGIPLKIMSPALDFLLLDSNRKKGQLPRSGGCKAGTQRPSGKTGKMGRAGGIA
ncbi:MAG: 16S rRNA (guanine(527)-N(7))-methyltransferase RsmG [Syntrophobacteraceae bacterium]